jgi:hypothetical protein
MAHTNWAWGCGDGMRKSVNKYPFSISRAIDLGADHVFLKRIRLTGVGLPEKQFQSVGRASLPVDLISSPNLHE